MALLRARRSVLVIVLLPGHPAELARLARVSDDALRGPRETGVIPREVDLSGRDGGLFVRCTAQGFPPFDDHATDGAVVADRAAHGGAGVSVGVDLSCFVFLVLQSRPCQGLRLSVSESS